MYPPQQKRSKSPSQYKPPTKGPESIRTKTHANPTFGGVPSESKPEIPPRPGLFSHKKGCPAKKHTAFTAAHGKTTSCPTPQGVDAISADSGMGTGLSSYPLLKVTNFWWAKIRTPNHENQRNRRSNDSTKTTSFAPEGQSFGRIEGTASGQSFDCGLRTFENQRTSLFGKAKARCNTTGLCSDPLPKFIFSWVRWKPRLSPKGLKSQGDGWGPQRPGSGKPCEAWIPPGSPPRHLPCLNKNRQLGHREGSIT